MTAQKTLQTEVQKPVEAFFLSEKFQLGSAVAALFVLLVVVGGIEYTLPNKNATLAAVAAAPAPIHSEAFSGITLTGKSAYVADISTGRVLYVKDADVQLPLASITKVALALAVNEVLSPDATLIMPRDTVPRGMVGLYGGEEWRVRDVIDFTLVASNNIGAEILANAADLPLQQKYREAPQGKAALWRMNTLAQEIGLTKTYFLNVSGLDESESHSGAYGSAEDVAKLLAYAYSTAPDVFLRTADDSLTLFSAGNERTIAYNTNEALGNIPGLIMGKTGLTDLAGGNLAIVFEAGPSRPIVAVVLGSSREGRFTDIETLVETTLLALSESP